MKQSYKKTITLVVQLLLIATIGQALRNGAVVCSSINLFSVIKRLKLNGYQPMAKSKYLLCEIVEARNYSVLNKSNNTLKINPFTNQINI